MADYEIDVFESDATSTVTLVVGGTFALDIDIADYQVNNLAVTEVSFVEVDLPLSLTAQQGPPGDTMVYVQEANPSTQYGWGAGDAGKVWIPATGL